MYVIFATIVGICIGVLLGGLELGLLLGAVAGLIALHFSTSAQISSLSSQIKNLKARLNHLEEAAEDTSHVSQRGPSQPDQFELEFDLDLDAESVHQKNVAIQRETIVAESIASVHTSNKPRRRPAPAPSPQRQQDIQLSGLDKLIGQICGAVVSYFTTGNIFVRVGLLVLFAGVAFLLKYAAEHSKIPLELRFIGAVLCGLVLMGVGWRLRVKKATYALLLQGGGVGIIYITIFASYRIAALIPTTLTFALLVLFTVITAILAVLQNSKSLALYAALGGFLAPFLASSGSGNYVGLFSYYAVLNLLIISVAWFKSWRILNLTGFLFTFGVFTVWFVSSYQTDMRITASLFLMLFFVMYSILGVMYALKQEHNLKGIIDGTLVFGTPLVVSSLLFGMWRHQDYGIAIIAICLGIYYLVTAQCLWRRIGKQIQLLAEAMLAIGVVFGTLAIPYALDGHWSSATWALEAAGILWVSIRQQRFYAQVLAILLQIGAAVLFLMTSADHFGQVAWINPAFMGGLFIALGALISARLLSKHNPGHTLRPAHGVFYVWGMGWWLVSVMNQIDQYMTTYQISALLALLIATVVILAYLDRIRKWNWLPASINLALFLPALVCLVWLAWWKHGHILLWPDALFWAVALALCYWIIVKLEELSWPKYVVTALHTGFVVLVSCTFSVELFWYIESRLVQLGDGYLALAMTFPLLAMYSVIQQNLPAVQRLGSMLQCTLLGALACVFILWSFPANLSNSASAAPLPYLPLINPFDLIHLVFFILLAQSIRLFENMQRAWVHQLLISLGVLIFFWLSAVLLRSIHHYANIPLEFSTMVSNNQVQTGLSILWTLIGMFSILFAAKKLIRTLWIAGTVLIGVVLIKLIFVDLGGSGTIERITSFLVVGGLLVAMGYFSPIPPRKQSIDQSKEEVVGD